MPRRLPGRERWPRGGLIGGNRKRHGRRLLDQGSLVIRLLGSMIPVASKGYSGACRQEQLLVPYFEGRCHLHAVPISTVCPPQKCRCPDEGIDLAAATPKEASRCSQNRVRRWVAATEDPKENRRSKPIQQPRGPSSDIDQSYQQSIKSVAAKLLVIQWLLSCCATRKKVLKAPPAELVLASTFEVPCSGVGCRSFSGRALPPDRALFFWPMKETARGAHSGLKVAMSSRLCGVPGTDRRHGSPPDTKKAPG